ncbi:MAG: DUF3169 family protein, partial [Oscillospiraceae bacterium]
VMMWGLIGGTIGFCASHFSLNIGEMIELIFHWIVKSSTVLLALCYIPMALAAANLIKGKKYVVMALSQEEEEPFQKADDYIEKSITWGSYSMILSFAAFGIMASGMIEGGIAGIKGVLISLALFVLLLIILTVLQYMAVEETKKMYPEKRGNVLEEKFQKDWFFSCDEAERAKIGEAAYASHMALAKAFVIYFAAAVMLSIVIPIGPLPVIIVSSLWFIQNMTYLNTIKKQK